MANRDEHNEFETAKWDAEEVRRQASSSQHRASSRKRKNKRTNTLIYLACVVLASCLLAGVGWLLVNDVCSLNKAPVEVKLVVEEGDTLSDVANKLKDAGLINYKGVFKLTSGLFKYKSYVEPGSYDLNSDMDYRALIRNMHDWDADSKESQGLVDITIPEGYTVREIIDLLAQNGVATVEELEDACANFEFADYDFLDSDQLGSIDRMEGFLFPTTYEFDKNKSAVYAVDTMLTMFKSQISQQMLADIEASPYTLREIVTMASLSRRSPSATTRSARTSAPSSTTVWRTPTAKRADGRSSSAPPSTIL